MNRITRNHALMETAYLWAQRSTCTRLNVGCVIHRDGRILVQGYNGAPAGLPHCDHRCDCPGGLERILRREFAHRPECNSLKPCTRAVHAEQNSISFAARWGVGLEGAHAMITHQPCVSCAQSMINAGLKSVHYVEPYRLPDGINLLGEAGMHVTRMLDFPIPS